MYSFYICIRYLFLPILTDVFVPQSQKRSIETERIRLSSVSPDSFVWKIHSLCKLGRQSTLEITQSVFFCLFVVKSHSASHSSDTFQLLLGDPEAFHRKKLLSSVISGSVLGSLPSRIISSSEILQWKIQEAFKSDAWNISFWWGGAASQLDPDEGARQNLQRSLISSASICSFVF